MLGGNLEVTEFNLIAGHLGKPRPRDKVAEPVESKGRIRIEVNRAKVLQTPLVSRGVHVMS